MGAPIFQQSIAIVVDRGRSEEAQAQTAFSMRIEKIYCPRPIGVTVEVVIGAQRIVLSETHTPVEASASPDDVILVIARNDTDRPHSLLITLFGQAEINAEKAFVIRFITPEFIEAFAALTDAQRKDVLEAMGDPCSRCGALDEMWCCYDPKED